jgi:hypothetical protein
VGSGTPRPHHPQLPLGPAARVPPRFLLNPGRLRCLPTFFVIHPRLRHAAGLPSPCPAMRQTDCTAACAPASRGSLLARHLACCGLQAGATLANLEQHVAQGFRDAQTLACFIAPGFSYAADLAL